MSHHLNSQLKVVRYDPKRRRLWQLLWVLLTVAISGIAYWWGGEYEIGEDRRLLKRSAELREQVQTLQAANQELSQQVAILESAARIDRLAVEQLRGLVKDLEDDKATLAKERAFYRSIIAPEAVTTGVRIHALELLAGDAPRVFNLRLVIAQVAPHNPLLKGQVSLTVIGRQEDKEVALSLLPLAGLSTTSMPLGFRYFQALPNSREWLAFTLPEHFVPRAIQVMVKIRSGSVQTLDKIYDWEKELAVDVEQEQATQ